MPSKKRQGKILMRRIVGCYFQLCAVEVFFDIELNRIIKSDVEER